MARRIDIVFDVCRESSIKNAERVRRITGKLKFSSIIPTQKIQQWHSFLSNNTNKTSVVPLLNEDWKKEKYMPYFEGRQIFFMCGKVFSYYNGFRWENVNELVSNQEEADTRLLLHSHHASKNGFNGIMIHTSDTNLFLLMVSMSNEIAGKLYMKTGARGKTRMINIADVKDQLDGKLSVENIDYVLEGLPGLHAFTGCDTVSASSGKGKIKALKIILKYEMFTNLFQSLGQEDDVSDEIYELSEQFICNLYDHKEVPDVNAV